MLTDWIHWLSSLNPDILLATFIGLLLIDGPRYALSKILMCLWDCGHDCWQWLRGQEPEPGDRYCPSVCVIIPGYNEADSIAGTLASVWGSYPRLEIMVVDDGSTDGTAAVARHFGQRHPGVLVLRRPVRGGKSSALNWALRHTRAEVLVCLDADSRLGPGALWEIVQPLRDPQVGLVSAAVLVRTPFTNLLTWLQAYEYLHTSFVGRLLAARLGILGIASGAFAAARRTALEQSLGWDVGTGEDLDLTLRVRKSGYQIAFAPDAQCFTEAPTNCGGLIRQRLRWDRDACIRNYCRKHIDLAYFTSRNFRFGDFCLWFETLYLRLFCLYGILAWFIWLVLARPYRPDTEVSGFMILVSLYLCYVAFEIIQVITVFLYSRAPGRDALICVVFFLAPLYQLFLTSVRLVATTQEIFWRKSFQDNFVPARVREATWHW